MEYRMLGRTGIKVSAIGIGGEGFENKSYEECEAIIDCAIKEGINFIDIYNSNPEVRSNVGKALSKYPRDSFVIEGHLFLNKKVSIIRVFAIFCVAKFTKKWYIRII